jgi:hypothetical protein
MNDLKYLKYLGIPIASKFDSGGNEYENKSG